MVTIPGCDRCGSEAVTYIRYSGVHLCRSHFLEFVERRVRKDLKRQTTKDGWKGRLRIAVALSGGKDSTACLALLKRILGDRSNADLVALLVNEGIEGYRERTVQVARDLCDDLEVPLVEGSFEKEFGLTTDDIAALPTEQSPCSYCGVLRRWLLNVMAKDVGARYLATGLNLDDFAQSVLMNMARGDAGKMARMGPHKRKKRGLVPRIAPLRVIPEKESYLFSHLMGFGFRDVRCPNSSEAVRNTYRRMIFELEDESPGTRHCLLASMKDVKEALMEREGEVELTVCRSCGEPTYEGVCAACGQLEKARRLLEEE